MYFEGSVVGKASIIGNVEMSPTPPLIFTGVGQKAPNLASFKTPLNFDRPMSWLSLAKLGRRTPEKTMSVLPHSLKFHAKRAKSSIYLSCGLFDFAQITKYRV